MNLKKFLLELDVENKWKQECSVDWLTGETITDQLKINCLDSWFTHCSSFLSAVCFKLNIPFLIPPEVRTEGLANKQCKWLNEKGNKYGWLFVTQDQLVNYINENYFIVACQYCISDPNCGHVAIIVDHVDNNIFVCQAGKINSSYMNICDAFCCLDQIQYWVYTNKNLNYEFIC